MSFLKKFFFDDSNSQYLYILPQNENLARWEILEQEELEEKLDNDKLVEGCRLFKIEREIKVSFERVTHLD